MISPKQIKRISSSQLQINWTDAREDIIPSITLRQNCPCASCAEQRGDLNHAKPLSAPIVKKSALSIISNSIEEETSLSEVWGIGNYALGCRWGDGHSTGIYTFDKLRKIGDAIIAAKSAKETLARDPIGEASDH